MTAAHDKLCSMTVSERMYHSSEIFKQLAEVKEWTAKMERLLSSLHPRISNAADKVMAERAQDEAECTYRCIVNEQTANAASDNLQGFKERVRARAHAALPEANRRARTLGLPPRDVADIAQAGPSSSRDPQEVVIKREEPNVVDNQRASIQGTNIPRIVVDDTNAAPSNVATSAASTSSSASDLEAKPSRKSESHHTFDSSFSLSRAPDHLLPAAKGPTTMTRLKRTTAASSLASEAA